jgi:hypothetical protein
VRSLGVMDSATMHLFEKRGAEPAVSRPPV